MANKGPMEEAALAGAGGEGVAGMSEWVLDLQAELQELANIEAESMSCPSYEGQGFFI